MINLQNSLIPDEIMDEVIDDTRLAVEREVDLFLKFIRCFLLAELQGEFDLQILNMLCGLQLGNSWYLDR